MIDGDDNGIAQQLAFHRPDPGEALTGAELEALIAGLLLVAPEQTPIQDLVSATGAALEEVEQTLTRMQREDSRGWVVVRHRDTVHLASAPRFAGYVRRFLRLDREYRLSGAALEALAIVAYRQPVTRAELEALRGVDCAGVLATLHGRGLIEVCGRLPSVGNPLQYATTAEFLHHFGMSSLDDLPLLAEFGEFLNATEHAQTTSLPHAAEARSPQRPAGAIDLARSTASERAPTA